jgi:sulfatase modifying factor 1
MTKRRVTVVASVCTGLVGILATLAACSAVLGIGDFTAGGGTSRDATTDHPGSGDDGTTPGDDGGREAAVLTCETQDGGAGAVGCPCTVGASGCSGYAQPGKLVCSSGTWSTFGGCDAGQNCDTRMLSTQGSCLTIDTSCADASPGATICVGANVVQCGPDLVSESPVMTCSHACVNGGCTGVCTPGTSQCMGNGVQTCNALGMWSATSACAGVCTDGGCETFPSCATSGPGADTTCGPGSDAGTGGHNCCTSYDVTGTSTTPFYRSYDGISPGLYTSKNAPATVSSYRLDAYEVTVGRFRAFVNAFSGDAGAAIPAAGSGKHMHLNGGGGLTSVGVDASGFESGWESAWNTNLAPTDGNLGSCVNATWTSSGSGDEHLPMNCVNWYEAYAFCIWDGGFLPSELEWNYAAAGGTEQRQYPWPDSAGPADASPPGIDCTLANYCPSGGSPCSAPCSGTGASDVGSESPTGDGKWGQSDLAGNLWEWALDVYTPSYPAGQCNDCANLGVSGTRVTRGGAFNLVASAVDSSYRNSYTPTTRDGTVGFRCARVP